MPHAGCPVINHHLSNSISILNTKMMLSPGSLEWLKFYADGEIQKYKGRGEDGRGRRKTDFAWQKGCSSLSSAPFPSCCPPPHCHMCTVFLGIPQTRLLAHLLHTLKAESKLCMQYGKLICFGGHKPTTKSFPASLETCGRQEVPEGWRPASDRRGHGALSLEIMLLPFPLPASNMRAVASVRHLIPYCATTGGWRIGPPRSGGRGEWRWGVVQL